MITIIKLFNIKKDKPEEPLAFQDWLGIDKIKDGTIKLKNGKSITILKVNPINFKLKSKLEQNAILNQYKLFLKNLKSNIQIIISSKKTDISYHIDEVLKSTNDNPQIKEMSEDYLIFLKQMLSEKGSITKEFYIAVDNTLNIENEILTIKEYLENCGNDVERCTSDEAEMLVKAFVNKRISDLI